MIILIFLRFFILNIKARCSSISNALNLNISKRAAVFGVFKLIIEINILVIPSRYF